jgi:hypothetical protein
MSNIKLLNTVQAREILGGLTAVKFNKLLDDGLPHFKVGKSSRFVEETIVKWYNSYSGGAVELAEILECPVSSARKFIEKYELEFDRDDNGNIIIDEGNLMLAFATAEEDTRQNREQRKANRKTKKETEAEHSDSEVSGEIASPEDGDTYPNLTSEAELHASLDKLTKEADILENVA